LSDFVCVLFLGDFDRRLFDGDGLVTLDGEFGDVLEDCLDVQRRSLFNGEFEDLRLSDRLDAESEDSVVEALGQQTVDYILADLVEEATLDDRIGHLAGAESRDLGVFLEVADHGAIGLGDFFGGHIEEQFMGAVGIQDRSVLVSMIVAFMVMIVVFMRVGFERVEMAFMAISLGGLREGSDFGGVRRTQRFAFQAHRRRTNCGRYRSLRLAQAVRQRTPSVLTGNFITRRRE